MVDAVIPGTIHHGKEYISNTCLPEEKKKVFEVEPIMALDFFAGCVGGCAGVVVGHPFDTVKVKLQTQNNKNPIYRGTWDCFSKIIKTESVAGVYKGVSSPMAGVAVVNAIVFGVYGNVQRNMSEPDSIRTHFLAGATAGLTQSVIASPVELVKSRVQVSSLYNGPWDCFLKTYKQEGVRGVFKGLGVTGVREFFGYGLYFATYEFLTKTSPDDAPISTASMLLAGGVSGTISWIFTYPLDVVKTRLQVDIGKYSSFADCIHKSVKAEGFVCLTRGLTPTLIRAFPTNAVTFAVVTWVFRLTELAIDNSANIRASATAVLGNITVLSEILMKNSVNGDDIDSNSLALAISDGLVQSVTPKQKPLLHENKCFFQETKKDSVISPDEECNSFTHQISVEDVDTTNNNQEVEENTKILR